MMHESKYCVDTNVLVSIVVPVYGVEQYLDECIRSLVNQTYRNIEILLIDDGSIDRSGEICDAWGNQDSRIRVFHKANEGLGLTRNYGLERARGKYIIFPDADDYLAVDMIEKMLWERERADADTVIIGYSRFRGDKILYTEKYQYAVYADEHVKKELLPRFIGSMPDKKDGLFQTAWCKLFSTEVIRENNLLFVSEREWLGEDMVFMLDYFYYSKKVVVSDMVLYYYRKNEVSLTGRYRADTFEKQKKIYFYIKSKISEYGLPEKEYLRLGKLFLVQIRGAITNEFKAGRKPTNCRKRIQDILNDGIVEDALENYPIRQLNPIQQCFAYMVRNKFGWGVYVCFWLYNLLP